MDVKGLRSKHQRRGYVMTMTGTNPQDQDRLSKFLWRIAREQYPDGFPRPPVGTPVGKIRYSGHHDIFLASAKEDLRGEARIVDEVMEPKRVQHNEWAIRETARLMAALRDVDLLLADLQEWKAEQIAADSLYLFQDLVEDAETALLDRHREILDALDHNPNIRVYPDLVSYRAYRTERHRKRIQRHAELAVAEKATVSVWDGWIDALEAALPQVTGSEKREVPK